MPPTKSREDRHHEAALPSTRRQSRDKDTRHQRPAREKSETMGARPTHGEELKGSTRVSRERHIGHPARESQDQLANKSRWDVKELPQDVAHKADGGAEHRPSRDRDARGGAKGATIKTYPPSEKRKQMEDIYDDKIRKRLKVRVIFLWPFLYCSIIENYQIFLFCRKC